MQVVIYIYIYLHESVFSFVDKIGTFLTSTVVKNKEISLHFFLPFDSSPLSNTSDLEQPFPDTQQVSGPVQQSNSSHSQQPTCTQPSLSPELELCIGLSSSPEVDPLSIPTPSVPLSATTLSNLTGAQATKPSHYVARYVPISSTTSGSEYVLVPSSGVPISTHS